jgi:hypothetical protein
LAGQASIAVQQASKIPPQDKSTKKPTEAKKEPNKQGINHHFKAIWHQRLKEQSKIARLKKKPLMEKKSSAKMSFVEKTKNNSLSGIRDKQILPELLPSINSYVMRKSEIEEGVLIQAQCSNSSREEINKLIKKMTLGFSASKNESSFFMKDGLFAGASFYLTTHDQDLLMKVKHGSLSSYEILADHEEYLRLKLHHHEINLREIVFS